MRPWTMPLLLCAFAAGAQSDTLTVLTYNIRYDNQADGPDRWDLRKEALAGVVKDVRPALIGLQEALVHQLTYLDAQWPGHARFGVGREDGDRQGEFSPIYYDTARFALAGGTTLWLSPTPDTVSKGWDAACERIATWAVLRDRVKGDSIVVVNTHWDHVGSEARLRSAELLLGRIHPVLVQGTDVLLMGDLNAIPDDPALRVLDQLLLNACPEEQGATGTYNGFGRQPPPLPRIDHVLITPTRWRIVGYAVPHPLVNGREVSDHYPLVVTLTR